MFGRPLERALFPPAQLFMRGGDFGENGVDLLLLDPLCLLRPLRAAESPFAGFFTFGVIRSYAAE